MSARAIGFIDAKRGDGNQEIEKIFSPEFRNRLDEIVRFNALPAEVMEKVVDKFVKELQDQLAERKIKIEVRPRGPQAPGKEGL